MTNKKKQALNERTLQDILIKKYDNFCKLRLERCRLDTFDWEFNIAINQLLEEIICHLPKDYFDAIIKYNKGH